MVLLLSLASGGCAGLRPNHPPAAQTAAEPASGAQPQTAQIDTPVSDKAVSDAPVSDAPVGGKTVSDAAQAQAAAPSTEPSTDGRSATPPCTCAEAKPKPRPRTKHKHVRKAAPPQLSTAPVVAETAPGSTVVAEVRSMPVSVVSILGKRVKGPKGEDLGRVVDVLADASGRVRTAIIDFGGFLGVGNHRIAVDWPLLRFDPKSAESPLLLSVNVEQLRTAPEYKDNPRPQTLMEPDAKAPPRTDSASEPKK
jgi:hypothetical protein